MKNTVGAVPRARKGGGSSAMPPVFSPDPHTAQVLLKSTGLPRLCSEREESGESWLLWAHQHEASGRLGTHSAEVFSHSARRRKEQNSKAGGSSK